MLTVIFSLISKIQRCSSKVASSIATPAPPPTNNYMQLPPPKLDRMYGFAVVEPPYPSVYTYPSMDVDNIDSLPDPACQECYWQGGGVGGVPGRGDCRASELGEAVRLLQHSMAK